MRPLLLIHGLADDNVVAAHTLRLSSALLAAGRAAHACCRCPGVTHMTPQEVVAENLLLLQVGFLEEGPLTAMPHPRQRSTIGSTTGRLAPDESSNVRPITEAPLRRRPAGACSNSS